MSVNNSTLTQARLMEPLSYDAETGIFRWRINRRRILAGEIAGTDWTGGYRGIMIADRRYYSHRLAWLYEYGAWPNEIDHINRNRSDNRIANLRDVTRSQNNQNRQLGKRAESVALGVRRARLPGKWIASIVRGGVRTHLGTFDSLQKASDSYARARRAWDLACLSKENGPLTIS